MRLIKIICLGVVLGLVVTFGYVRYQDIMTYSDIVINNRVTDQEAQDIYTKLAQVSGQGNIIPTVLHITESDTVNAYTTIKGITIYTGLLKQLDRDEVALVLGHEISHFVLGHVFSLTVNTPSSVIRINEMQADKYGAFLAMRAGYDICKGRQFFKKMDEEFGDNQDEDHPDFSFRYDQLNINCGG